MPFPTTLQQLAELPRLVNVAGLPTTTRLSDCADFHSTFLAYLPQLYALPAALAAHITDREALKSLYLTTNPAISSLGFSIALFPLFFLGSEVNGNYSQVDRVWSILPTLFHAHYAIWARLNGLPTARLDHVLAFSAVWTLRLTYNYWRKGGYEIGSEDYRWKIIQERIGRVGFLVLNVLFISTWQVLILWAVTTPAYILLLVSRHYPEVGLYDTLFSRALTALVVIAYFADQQQWDFQQAKKTYRATAKVPLGWTQNQMERGFITTGLWRWSRHPNFAAEQALWVVLYAWGCWHAGTAWNWTAVGVLHYLAVFQGSTPLTEMISAGKYAEYKTYQQRVGKFLPKLFGRRWNEEEAEVAGQEKKK